LALVTVELSVFVIVMLYRPVVVPAGITSVPVICVGETTLTFVRDIDVGVQGESNIPYIWVSRKDLTGPETTGTTFTIVVKEKT
jgi:hypothetical protein